MASWVVSGFSEERELGSGASGRVVAAVRAVDGQRVAIKYLSPRLSSDPQFLEAFRAEAVLLGTLDVPQVVRLLDYVEVPGQGAAIIMELVEGVSLHEMITRQGPATPESALLVLKGSLLGLAAVHALGIVHRDYKPENVLVDGAGQSKLSDFGVAIRAGQDAGAGGTPLYMAPEQWAGQAATPATDIYAATAVFFECLTGMTPFSGPLGQLAAQHAAAAVPVEMVSEEPLRELITRGMAKDPADRPANATAFMTDLETTALAAYGADWEDRGRGHLAERAAALPLLLLPHGGAAAGAGTGTTTTSTWLPATIRTVARLGRGGQHAWLYAGIAASVIGIAAGSLAAVTLSAGHGGAPGSHLAGNAAHIRVPTSAPPPPTSQPPPTTEPPTSAAPPTTPPPTSGPPPASQPPPTSAAPPTTPPPTSGSPPTSQPPPTSGPPSSPPGGGTSPPWAGSLGPGITIESPSDGWGLDTVYGYMNNLHPQDSPAPCQYVVPSSQSACQSVLNAAAQNGTFVEVTYQSIGVGYAAIDGNEALVVFDYAQLCLWRGIQENCLPDNNDLAALLDSGQSFSTLWAEATSGSNNEVELIPLLQVNGTWYVDYSSFQYPAWVGAVT